MSRSRLSFVAATLLAACVDGTAGPGSFGELRIRPNFVASDAPGTIGVELDSAAVRVVRPAEATTPLIDTTVAYQSDTASLGWIVDLREDEESLRATVVLWGGNNQLYSGEADVTVRDGAIANTTVEPVAVAYVGPAIVATVTVSPDATTLDALGATRGLVAEARDRHNQIVAGAAFTWQSADDRIASVDPSTGVVTAEGNGFTTVTAAAGAATGGASIVVAQSVASIVITPASAMLTALGATQTLVAHATDANGHPVDGATFAWTSATPGVVSVDPETGIVTAVAGGSATITALSSNGFEATALVTVNPIADVASITVTPSTATLLTIGATRQFTAVARDAGGALLDGVQFTWSSSVVGVATIDPQTGLSRSAGHGATVITAGAGAITGTAALTVDLSTSIATVAVTPAVANLTAVGAIQPFIAEARDGNGNPIPVTDFVWSSSAGGVAAVDAATGIATAVSHGATTIRATVAGKFGEASLTVDLRESVASVTVTPPTATLTTLGATRAFAAVARDGAGNVLSGVPFIWSTSAPAVAVVDADGLAEATGHGAATITATSGGHQGSAALTVDLTSAVVSIAVSPATAMLRAVGGTQQFNAVARDAHGAVVPGIEFAWTSAQPAVAQIGSTGIATAHGHGQTTIAASVNGASGHALLTVDLSETIVRIDVTPAAPTLTAPGATQQFVAIARDAGGDVVPVVGFDWSSGNQAIATVGASGLATARAHGQTTIAAAVGTVQGSAVLTVNLSGLVATVQVTPSYVTLKALGTTQAFSAVARDVNGDVVPGVTFAWSSSASAVATIDAGGGVATAVGNGTTTITAAAGGVSGTATLKVYQKVASVVVTPATATLIGKDKSQQFVAQAFDANGHLVSGATFSWWSSNTSVAKVSATGLATPCGYGTTKIKATSGFVSGYATLTVKRAY